MAARAGARRPSPGIPRSACCHANGWTAHDAKRWCATGRCAPTPPVVIVAPVTKETSCCATSTPRSSPTALATVMPTLRARRPRSETKAGGGGARSCPADRGRRRSNLGAAACYPSRGAKAWARAAPSGSEQKQPRGWPLRARANGAWGARAAHLAFVERSRRRVQGFVLSRTAWLYLRK
jgi:hypothetical protein